MKTEKEEQANKEQNGTKQKQQPDDRFTPKCINNRIKYKWSKYTQLKKIAKLDFLKSKI